MDSADDRRIGVDLADIANALEAQRNDAMNDAAKKEAAVRALQRENVALKKEVEALKAKKKR